MNVYLCSLHSLQRRDYLFVVVSSARNETVGVLLLLYLTARHASPAFSAGCALYCIGSSSWILLFSVGFRFIVAGG